MKTSVRKNGFNRIRFLERIAPGLAEWIEFFGSFLREPARVGALAPSSPVLAHAMLVGCAMGRAKTVVEFGPGTGAFTRAILERLPRRSLFFALELNQAQVISLRERFPGLHVHHDCAETIQKYLEHHQRKNADFIISGLPWVNMPDRVQEQILSKAVGALAPGGIFTTFTYVHAFWFPRACDFRRRLKNHFAEVQISPVVWRNIPPAVVYRCRLRE